MLPTAGKLEPDCIFFALKGENFNGNEFADEALKKGAAYSIIDDEQYYSSQKTILVENTLETLQELARLHRQKLGIPILAITGTNGKTTTKELIATVLSKKYKVVYTQRKFKQPYWCSFNLAFNVSRNGIWSGGNGGKSSR